VPVRVPAWGPEQSSPGQPVLLYVGRFSTEKNLSSWIRVASRVARHAPELRLLLVGDGAQRRAVARDLALAGFADRAELPGWVSNRRLGELYRRATVLLLTSRSEGFGRVALEAGLHGLPVVAPAVAGLLDIVDHGETGFLHRPEDAEGMAASVLQLIGDPARARAMGELARRRLVSRFDPRRLSAGWVDLLVAISRRGRTSPAG
jgi:glycosyltransferase involved in cell wall biosynthesis